jgi:hypothetical protein
MRWLAKGVELHALLALEARQRFGQTDHADLDQIIQLDVRWQFGDHVQGNPTHKRHMLTNQRVAVELAFGGVHGSQWLQTRDSGAAAGGLGMHGQDAGRLEHVQRELMQIAGLAPAQAHEHRGIAQVALRTL